MHNGLNLHFQSGLVRGEDSYEDLATALQLPAAANFARFDPLNQTYSREFHRVTLAPLERQVSE